MVKSYRGGENWSALGGLVALVLWAVPGLAIYGCTGAPDDDDSDSTVAPGDDYEGELNEAHIRVGDAYLVQDLVEGTALSKATADSHGEDRVLMRYPNGTDTDNASSDWTISTVLTPGAANELPEE